MSAHITNCSARVDTLIFNTARHLLTSCIIALTIPPEFAQSAALNNSATSSTGATDTTDVIKVATYTNTYQQLFGLINDSDDIVLDVISGRGTNLAQNIAAKRRDGKIYFDLIAFSSVIGGIIEWDGAELARGWLRAEKDATVIDLSAGRLKHRGVVSQLSPSDAFAENGMLCIDANIVAALYGVELTIDLSRLRATINGPPTATERRLLRAQNQRRISNGNTDTSLKDADFAGYDEKALNHIRMTVSSRYQRRGGRNGTASETGSVFTDARFDAFRSRMKIIVNASQSKGTTRKDGITDFRISSQRVNPGDATYTEFNIGDVTPYRVVNGGSTKPGVGFRLTNRPLHQPQIVGEEVISGDAPPGWEVELYLDDSLIDVVTVDDSGQYEFPAASLKSGKNNFTIKIHGPEGQLQTIERNVFANHGVPPKGTLRYAVSAQQDDRTLTGNREHYRRKTSPDSFRGRQRDRFASDLRYATTNETALTGGFSHIPHKDSDNHLSTIGVRSNLAGRTYTLDVTKAGGDATGTAIRAYTRLLMGSASGNITYRHYDNFSGQAAKYGFSYHRNKLDIHMNMPFRNLGNDNKT